MKWFNTKKGTIYLEVEWTRFYIGFGCGDSWGWWDLRLGPLTLSYYQHISLYDYLS